MSLHRSVSYVVAYTPPQPSPPGRGGTSAASRWGGRASTASDRCGGQVSTGDEPRRVSRSRRVSASRSGNDRSTLSPGERDGVRADRDGCSGYAVAANCSFQVPMSNEQSLRTKSADTGNWMRKESGLRNMFPASPSPRPSPPGRGGTSAASRWDGRASTAAERCGGQVSTGDEPRRVSRSRRVSASRSGNDRSTLSPGERDGVRKASSSGLQRQQTSLVTL